MPEELRLEDANGREITNIGDEQALPAFSRLVRGMPSATQTVVVRNLSESRAFVGEAVVSPAAGRSYAEDLEVRSADSPWGRSAELRIAPSSTAIVYARVLPLSTPEGSSGRAGLYVEGDFPTDEPAARTQGLHKGENP